MRTAHGPGLKRPRSAGVPTPRASSCGAVWRNSLPREQPGASWPIHWAGRSMVCSSATRRSLGPSSSGPTGAERVRPAPHWPQKGCASRKPARWPTCLRLCTPRGASDPSPYALAMAWPPALAPEARARVASGSVGCPAPAPATHWRANDTPPGVWRRTVRGHGIMARSQRIPAMRRCNRPTSGDGTSRSVWGSHVGWHPHTAITSGHETA
jgi:hypothetical protein